MPDLLSHVLLALTLLLVVSLWIPVRRYELTAGLFGAILPDASKVGLFFSDDGLETFVGGPIDFLAWHTLTGITLSVIAFSLIVEPRFRRRTTGFVVFGALSHVVFDLLLRTASGRTPYALFWPFSGYRLPTRGLYLSGDPGVLVFALGSAAAAWALVWTRRTRQGRR